jgi:hypothetical protein
MVWNTPASLQTEIVARMLVEKLGWNGAREIFPRNVNPNDASMLPAVTLRVPSRGESDPLRVCCAPSTPSTGPTYSLAPPNRLSAPYPLRLRGAV